MNSNKNVLSIQVNLNGLSFCIVNPNTQEVEHLHHIDFDASITPHELLPHLKRELSSKSVFAQDFSEVLVIHQNELSTLVPESLFDENHSADYLKFNSKILKSDYIAFDHLEAIQCKNVYVPYVNINNYIFDTFGQFTYKHSTSAFIETILKQLDRDETAVYLNLYQQSFELVVFKYGQLTLSNVHQYFSKEDLLYYVLFTFNQLELDPNTVEVKLSGYISEADAFYALLYDYIRHLSFITHNLGSIVPSINDNDQSKYLVLLSST